MAQQIAAQAQALGMDPQTYMQQGKGVPRLLAHAPAQHTIGPLLGRVAVAHAEQSGGHPDWK
jgi:cytochrome c551/c552